MRVSIMFRPQGNAPERAAQLVSALDGAGHRVSRLTADSAPAAVRAARRESPEVIHAVGVDAARDAWIASRASGSALVCEMLPGDTEVGGPAARALRAAAAEKRGGTVLVHDERKSKLLRERLGLPYLPPVVGGPGESEPTAVLLAVYDRLPSLSPRIAAGGSGRAARARSWLGELAEPVRRGALRRPGALLAYLRGRRLRARGRFPAAIDALTEAAERDGGDPVYDLFAAKALRESGAAEKALERLRSLAADADGNPALVGEVAVELERLGQTDSARALASRLASDGGDDRRLAEAARVHAVLGDLDSARELAMRAAAEAPDHSAAQRTAALALEQAGEPSEALALARRAGETDQERRLAGLLRELGPRWIPKLGRAAPDGRGNGARVMALLEVSLPHAPSGYAYRSRDLLSALRAGGFHPVAATRLGFPASRGLRTWSPVESVDGIIHHRFNVPGIRQYSGIPLDQQVQENAERVLDLVVRTDPAAIIAGTPDLNCRVALAARSATGVPVVYDVRGFPEMSWATQSGGSDSELYRRRREAETACAESADAVITLSETMRRELAGRGLDPERIFVVPQIVDTDRFSPRQPDEQLARSYGLEGRVVVGSVTSLTDYEGIDELLRAVAIARGERPEIAALIVGDGAFRPALEELAADLSIEDSVVFTGRIEQGRVPDHYALLDLFAIPRRDLEVCRAVTPLKPFEALAMGIPVVASALAALDEIVSASGGGRTVSPGSDRALADAIVDLCGDRSERERHGRSGREYVLGHHTPERASVALRAALAPLVGENGTRDEP
jgi:glycosyltransferase involved in cell wall biosynthesis